MPPLFTVGLRGVEVGCLRGTPAPQRPPRGYATVPGQPRRGCRLRRGGRRGQGPRRTVVARRQLLYHVFLLGWFGACVRCLFVYVVMVTPVTKPTDIQSVNTRSYI